MHQPPEEKADYSASIAAIQRCGEKQLNAAGAGIVIDRRRVLTCAHVVNEALGRDESEAEAPIGISIPVRVPLRKADRDKEFHMEVDPSCWRAPKDEPTSDELDDITVLVLCNDAEFPSDIVEARLIAEDLSDEHDRLVRATGFPGGGLDDRIHGRVNGLNTEGHIRVNRAIDSRSVTAGFSGAAIWDDDQAGVLGMLMIKRRLQDENVGYGPPMASVAKAFSLPIDQSSYRPSPEVLNTEALGPQAKETGNQPSLSAPTVRSDTFFHYTNSKARFVGREAELQTLEDILTDDPEHRFLWTQISGVAGQGKSRLALEFVGLVKARNETNPRQWSAGHLSPETLSNFDWAGWQPNQPYLMVVDYVIGNEATIKTMFDSLVERGS
ncbi:MAG: serine protease, partial [Geminicoccaceae bacterium]